VPTLRGSIVLTSALLLLSSVSWILSPVFAQRPSSSSFDTLLQSFWDAEQLDQADARAKHLLELQPAFDTLLDRLRTGPVYSAQRTGHVEMLTADASGPLDNIVEIPDDYTPARKWPVRIVLHGGVGRERPARGEAPRALTNRLPGTGEIVILPRAWLESAWWTEAGVRNVLGLLNRVKQRYNVDENRVHVTGVSDGGTGVYYLAMRAATPWSSCLALNGQPLVIANEDTGTDGQLYAHNMVNCPLYMVNGGKDPLYPASSMQPLVSMFKAGGIPLEFQVYPEAGHDVSWWPQERPRFERFVNAHPRVPHPESVSWETERTDRYNRFRWLVIDRLGQRPGDTPLKDVNEYEALGGLMSRTLFSRREPSGRVDAVRAGNAFDVKTRSVRDFTLLLSPDAVDFGRPVTVVVNGRKVHDAVVGKSAAMLLKWAARDRDRTMLYGAELHITVP